MGNILLTMSEFQLTSQAFDEGESIPSQFTCEGENASPPLTIHGVPKEAKELVLVVTDPDIPEEVKENMGIEIFDHWVVYAIAAEAVNNDEITIEVGQTPGAEGVNSSGDVGYTGPCPPAEYDPTEHRYVFSLYALDSKLDIKPQPSKTTVMEAMKGHILKKAELVGRYEKQNA
jgi:Raf kinase inhibitor-like YbhB/YbcL family protein